MSNDKKELRLPDISSENKKQAFKEGNMDNTGKLKSAGIEPVAEKNGKALKIKKHKP
jgi:hypothetical protein